MRTWERQLYLVALQAPTRSRIGGWSMADHMRAQLVADALHIALAHCRGYC